jgi:hypothetical protein
MAIVPPLNSLIEKNPMDPPHRRMFPAGGQSDQITGRMTRPIYS